MIHTFIYGSCVSRDTFEHLPSHQFDLVQYVARQSLISAMAPGSTDPVPHISTSSAFQRRMLEGDWNSSLLPQLKKHASSIDLLLWDLCDERLGVRSLGRAPGSPRSAIATRSVDSIRTGVDIQLGHTAPLITFGSRKHRLIFLRSLRLFVQTLHALGLQNKTLVLGPAWATTTVDGRPTPSSFGLNAHRANRLYSDYHKAIKYVSDLPVLDVTSGTVAASSSHPWGLAPFHYADNVYEELAAQILQRMR